MNARQTNELFAILSKLRCTKNLTVCTNFETINPTSVNRNIEKINRSELTVSLIQIICITLYHYF
jgi:hypothetical protein